MVADCVTKTPEDINAKPIITTHSGVTKVKSMPNMETITATRTVRAEPKRRNNLVDNGVITTPMR